MHEGWGHAGPLRSSSPSADGNWGRWVEAYLPCGAEVGGCWWVRSIAGLLPLGSGKLHFLEGLVLWVSPGSLAACRARGGWRARGGPVPRLPPVWPILVGSCARPRHEGLVGAGSRVGSPPGHSAGSVSSSASPGAPIHCKEGHAFPLEIRIEPDCAPGQSPASSAGPPRPGKGSQMVLA